MFCARCGEQIPEASEICPLCGQKATVELPAASAQTSAAPAPALDHTSSAFPLIRRDLQGVGGWLLFFCVITTILTPLGNLSSLIRLAEAESLWALYYCILVGFSFLVGMSVWRVSPFAMALVKVYFITLAVWELLRIPYVFVTSADPSLDLQMTMRIRTLVWVIVWAAYFHKSQRVRATFGRNL
jgi:hypothetical protein